MSEQYREFMKDYQKNTLQKECEAMYLELRAQAEENNSDEFILKQIKQHFTNKLNSMTDIYVSKMETEFEEHVKKQDEQIVKTEEILTKLKQKSVEQMKESYELRHVIDFHNLDVHYQYPVPVTDKDLRIDVKQVLKDVGVHIEDEMICAAYRVPTS